VDNAVRTAKIIYVRIRQTQRSKLEKLKVSRADDVYIRPHEVWGRSLLDGIVFARFGRVICRISITFNSENTSTGREKTFLPLSPYWCECHPDPLARELNHVRSVTGCFFAGKFQTTKCTSISANLIIFVSATKHYRGFRLVITKPIYCIQAAVRDEAKCILFNDFYAASFLRNRILEECTSWVEFHLLAHFALQLFSIPTKQCSRMPFQKQWTTSKWGSNIF
jgi:hypothetical protein